MSEGGELADTLMLGGHATMGDEPTEDGGPLASGVLLAGRWEVQALLGVGGMGSVFRARDRELDELVAIKVLRRELADAPAMLERFRREVKLARRVTHPNVARTFDIGEHDELRFLTMELLDGRPLSSLLVGRAPLSLARVIAIGRAICAGLGAAHAAGVIHRDLKPDNIVIERSGRIVITDFGIARALEIEGGASDTHGAVVGTPLYMAPEQIVHDAPIGPATDLYALGCILFELATGVPPWSGPTPLAIAAARLVAAPPSPASLVADLPTPFVALVGSLLARQVTERMASPADVDAALAALSPTLAASLPPTSAPGMSPVAGFDPRSAPRHPSTAATSAAWVATKTVAVLAIENRGDAADAYLAAGLTDDLIDLLSSSPGLRVRPRAVVERAHANAPSVQRDPREVGRDLDVQVVASGELRRLGDTLQVNVRVVTVEDGFQLWAGRFRAPAAEFLRIGDEAAAAIAEALLSRPLAARAAPTDARALDLYLRGRFLLRRTWGHIPEAVPLLREAVERAPSDRTIRLTYARALVRGVSVGELPEASGDEAEHIAEDAIRADADLPDALLARASVRLLRGQILDGISDLHAALRSSPDLEEATALVGDIMADADLQEPARQMLERAMALDPLHFSPRGALARMEALAGDFASALRTLGQPPNDRGDVDTYWISRARLALWSHDRDEANRIQRLYIDATAPKLMRRVVAIVVGVTLGTALVVDDETRRSFGIPPRASPRVMAFRYQFRAEVLASMGDRAEAVEAVVAAEAAGTFDLAWAARCPALEPLRNEPAFIDAVGRIRSRAERVRGAFARAGG